MNASRHPFVTPRDQMQELADNGIALFGVLEQALRQSTQALEVEWQKLVSHFNALAALQPPNDAQQQAIITGLQFQDRHTQLLEDTIRAMAQFRRMLEEASTQPAQNAPELAEKLLGSLRLSALRHGFERAIQGEASDVIEPPAPSAELF